MRFAWLTIIVALLATFPRPASVRGDAIELDSGERIEGKIIGGTANEVYFRRSGAAADAIEKFDRVHVLRVERDRRRPDSQPAEAASRPTADAVAHEPPAATPPPRTKGSEAFSRNGPARASQRGAASQSSKGAGQTRLLTPFPPATSAPAASGPSSNLPPQTQRALAMAIAEWRGEDFRQAGLELARLINAATPELREAMSAQTQAAVGMSLSALAADTHWRAAMANRRGSAIHLEYVTEYEKPVLAARMAAAYDAALRSREDLPAARTVPDPVAAPRHRPTDRRGAGPRAPASANPPAGMDSPRSSPTARPATSRPWYEALPPATQPVPAGAAEPQIEYAAIEWLGRPERFDGTPTQARSLAGRAAHALSILNERLRLDPALSRNGPQRRQLLQDKQRLAALTKILTSRANRPPIPEPDPKAVEAEKARREEFEKRMQEQQKAQQEEVRKTQEAARKWIAEQEKPKPGLFDWLKPQPAEEKK